jgi:hypothetical protein
MTIEEGGRHSYDNIPLELLENVGLPDPVASRGAQVERRVVGTRRWISELYTGVEIKVYESPVLSSSEGVKS